MGVTTTEGVFVAMGGMTTFPQVLGWDFAGVISSAGSSVAGWEPGDRVLGFSPQPWTGTGVIAELVVLPPGNCACWCRARAPRSKTVARARATASSVHKRSFLCYFLAHARWPGLEVV